MKIASLSSYLSPLPCVFVPAMHFYTGTCVCLTTAPWETWFITDANNNEANKKISHQIFIALTSDILCILSFQVYIRILDNEWNVYRRYAEFRTLHNYLRPQFPQVDTFNFPPKKAIGNKVATFLYNGRFFFF